MSKFTDWAEKKYSLPVRLITTLLGGIVFLFLIPYVLVKFGPLIDVRLRLSEVLASVNRLVFLFLFFIPGFVLALWTIASQILLAEGTPLPIVATQKLLITGPFKYSRNPMSLGTISMYMGISLYMGSISSIFITCCLTTLLLLYLKKIEEKEMEERFGSEYVRYKKLVPFIFPHFKK